VPQSRKNEALERTDKAISQMVKEAKKINFHTVAEAAGYQLLTSTNTIQLNSALTS